MGTRFHSLFLWVGLFAGSFLIPQAGHAYPCFYELNATCRLGGMQQRLAGHIDAALGSYNDTFNLGEMPNLKLPIIAAVVYNSGDNSIGPFGRGTSTPQDWFIVLSPVNNEYTLVGPGNVEYPFNVYNSTTHRGVDTFDPFLLGATLSVGTGYTLTWKNGTVWTFDSYGGLMKSVDSYGNGINITRDAGSGFVSTAAAIGSGGQVAYDLNNPYNQCWRVRLVYPGGATRTWSVAYTTDYIGYPILSSLTAPDGGVWHYGYHLNYVRPGQNVIVTPIQSITDPRGNRVVSLTWDSSGRMTTVAYPVTTYTLSWNSAYGSAGVVTAVNSRGHSTSINFGWIANHFGYLLNSFTDNTLGETTSFYCGNYPTNYLVTTVTDFRGRRTQYAWDNNTGHLLSRSWTAPSGATATESFGYDATSGALTSRTDALGRTTTYTVNSCGCVMTVTNPRGYTTNLTRDAYGNVTAVTNALNQTTANTYNSSGELLTSTDPLNHVTTWSYDSYLRPATAQDANGKTVSCTYDAMDRLLTVGQTVGGVPLTTTSTYDLNGNRIRVTDPKQQAWQWTFDTANRVIQATDPLGKSATITYDGDGNVAAVVDRVGNTASYSYDTADRLQSRTYTYFGGAPDSQVICGYDGTTHLLASVVDNAAPGNQTWNYVYDSRDRIIQVNTPNGTVNIGLNDKIDRRDSLQAGLQGTINYSFDNDDNRISQSVSDNQNLLTATLTYDALDRLTNRSLLSYGNPVNTAWAFDSAGFLTSVTSTCNGVILDSHNYLRDAVGNITQETIGGYASSTSTFAYDDLYRLTSAVVNGMSYSYVYDQVGNRTQETAGGAVTNYTYDSADHLLSVGGTAITSDANGSIQSDGAGGAYFWDVRGRLIGLLKGGNNYSFQYGPDNLRVARSVNGASTTYLLDGNQVVTDTSGGFGYQTIYGPGTDRPLERCGDLFVPNHLGSTTALTDALGNLSVTYSYGPFGETQAPAWDNNPFRYTGREDDGDGLLYYRARYYNPAWGRFISADRLGFAAGINPYVYAGNNPVNRADPSGEREGWNPPPLTKEEQVDLYNAAWKARAQAGAPPPMETWRMLGGPYHEQEVVIYPSNIHLYEFPEEGSGGIPVRRVPMILPRSYTSNLPPPTTPPAPTATPPAPTAPATSTPGHTHTEIPETLETPEDGATFMTDPETGGALGLLPALFHTLFKALTTPHYNPWTDPSNYPFGAPTIPPVIASQPTKGHRQLAILRNGKVVRQG